MQQLWSVWFSQCLDFYHSHSAWLFRKLWKSHESVIYSFCLSNRLNIYAYLKIIEKELQYCQQSIPVSKWKQRIKICVQKVIEFVGIGEGVRDTNPGLHLLQSKPLFLISIHNLFLEPLWLTNWHSGSQIPCTRWQMSVYLMQTYLTAGMTILEVLGFQFNTVLTGVWASHLRKVEKAWTVLLLSCSQFSTSRRASMSHSNPSVSL